MRVGPLASIAIAVVVVSACHNKPPTVAPTSAPEGHFAIVLCLHLNQGVGPQKTN